MSPVHPSIQRNRDPILAVLRRVLPTEGLVLEVASGSGHHAAWFVPRLPGIHWQPTDLAPSPARAAASERIRPMLHLDTRAPQWCVTQAAAVVCINMVHISPWATTLGLISGAARVLPPGGVLYLYGAYQVDGRHTAPSNAQFDAWLRTQNPAWGVRDLGDLVDAASPVGLELRETIEMPANNLSVIFQRQE